MRIKDVPEGYKIICCNSTAEVLSKGVMGTRVKVLTVPDETTGFPLGKQIWSNESVVSIVEHTNNEQIHSKVELSTQRKAEVPLLLF